MDELRKMLARAQLVAPYNSHAAALGKLCAALVATVEALTTDVGQLRAKVEALEAEMDRREDGNG
jgi:outer membrane murein-binding lipoprotein Lpp